MVRSHPYQPLPLRVFHGVNGLVVLGAIVTGFLVYNSFDGRFGELPLPRINNIIDLHGTLGLTLMFVFPVFALYSFHAGQKRLVQADSLSKLSQIGKPVWWYSLHRIVNTLFLVALGCALLSGRMMQESWLPLGELDHIWYSAHLTAWAVITLTIPIHLSMIIKVGGGPLLLSILSFSNRPGDNWQDWKQKFSSMLDRRSRP